MSVKVSPKYQVVIPEDVRKSLHITPGMQISVIAKGGIAYLVPVKGPEEIGKSLGSKITLELKEKARKSLREKKDRKP